jgi:hypothetical protein
MFLDSSSRCNIQLAPLPDSYGLDRGLLLSVQAIQVDPARFLVPVINNNNNNQSIILVLSKLR